MRYINNENFKLNNTVVTLGKFDGFHRGHMKLIERLREYNSTNDTVVFTFDISPLKLLGIHSDYILSKEERMYMYETLDVGVVVEYPFDENVMKMSPEEFVKEVLVDKLDARRIIVGSDYHFGYKRRGNVELLKELSTIYKYDLHIVDKLKYENEVISSTSIKKSVRSGDLSSSSKMLGYNYFIKSRIIDGKHLGRKLGFPTINQCISGDKATPPKGVYVSRILIDGKKHYGITNIGKAPTIENDSKLRAETYIFGFDEIIYGKEAKIELLKYIREEKKFLNVEELKNQISDDVNNAKNYLRENGDDGNEFIY